MEAILSIWIKIVAIIVIWEVWKHLGWKFACWIVDKQVEQYEKNKNK